MPRSDCRAAASTVRLLWIACVAAVRIASVSAFLPPRRPRPIVPATDGCNVRVLFGLGSRKQILPLRLARRSNGNKRRNGGGHVAPKRKKPNRATVGSKGRRTADPTNGRINADSDNGRSSTPPQQQQQMPKKPPTPPWKTVSKKDMKKLVNAEKLRRQQAQKGMHQSPADIRETQEEFTLSTAFLDTEDKSILAWKRYAPNPQDKVTFVGGYLNRQLPPRLGAPEIAFLGRSNVGKSSLLNKMMGTDAARVGKTPGATAAVNLYSVVRKGKNILGLVDLPGFGYAKLSKETKESVQQAAEHYLQRRKELAVGILLVDIRRKPSEDDKAVLAALFDMGVPIIVVATKIDKLSATQLDSALKTIRHGLGLPDGQPFFVSSVTGRGVKELWKIVMEACEDHVEELRQKKLREKPSDDADDGPGDFDSNSEDFVYDMGYDWVHNSQSVMYEGDESDASEYLQGSVDNNHDTPGFYDDEYDHEEPDENRHAAQDTQSQPMSIQALRKRVRQMEKEGKI